MWEGSHQAEVCRDYPYLLIERICIISMRLHQRVPDVQYKGPSGETVITLLLQVAVESRLSN